VIRKLLRQVVPRSIRLWALHPVQSAQWFRDVVTVRLGRAARVRMRDDWELRCHPAAVEAFAFERDQPELRAELDGFIASCREGMVLFDIGAHYGLFGLAALHWGGGTARVVAVDPSIAALAVFDENMRLADAGPRVERLCAALSDSEGHGLLLTGGAGAWHMMVTPDGPRDDAVRVPMMTLDGLAARTGAVPTHVKIDVEGEEGAVLRGGRGMLDAHAPIVFLELHGQILRRSGRSPAAVLEQLWNCGYRSFTIGAQEVSSETASAKDVARIICRK
jgi:FkbM family methyltransferase